MKKKIFFFLRLIQAIIFYISSLNAIKKAPLESENSVLNVAT